MLHFRKEIRKEIAYGIVEAWTMRDEGKRIVETYLNHGECAHITAALFMQESQCALENCVDKTFLVLQNILYQDIATALNDWLNENKPTISHARLKYGS